MGTPTTSRSRMATGLGHENAVNTFEARILDLDTTTSIARNV